MAHVLIPNTVKACFRMSRKGQTVCNVIHIDVGGTPNNSILQAVGSVLSTWAEDHLMPNTGSDTTLEVIELRDCTQHNGPGMDYTGGLPIVGSAPGSPLPNNSTVAIKKLSAQSGRSFRGRWFFNGFTDAQVDTSTDEVLTTFRDNLLTVFNELLTDVATAGFTAVIASTISGGDPRVTGIVTPWVDSFVNLTLDSMRKRLPGRGQ